VPERATIVDIPAGERPQLEWILEESFEGWYLRHSLGKLRDVEVVRAAQLSGKNVGLVMLKNIGKEVGYVYYLAVAREHRRTGVARMLLEDSLDRFRAAGMKDVFASAETDNLPSERLFASEGFTRTNFGEVSKRFGGLHAVDMYRRMLVVPGEVLLHKELG
jgi:ribosomal protein S18 acetylase RimI-like enzyme